MFKNINDLSYNNKITLEDYDEMISAIANIDSYFYSKINLRRKYLCMN